jgi:hypothetical protein
MVVLQEKALHVEETAWAKTPKGDSQTAPGLHLAPNTAW